MLFQQIAGDDHLLHLAGALIDAQRADFPIQFFDLGPLGDAEAAVHLYRHVDHLLRLVGGVELGHGRRPAIVGLAHVLLPSSAGDQQSRGVDGQRHLCQLFLCHRIIC